MALIYLFSGLVITLGVMGALSGVAVRVRELMEKQRPVEERRVLSIPNARFQPLELKGHELPWPSEVPRGASAFGPLPWPSEGWDDPAFGWKAREHASAQQNAAQQATRAEQATARESAHNQRLEAEGHTVKAKPSPAPKAKPAASPKPKNTKAEKATTKAREPAAKASPAQPPPGQGGYLDALNSARARALVEEHGLSGAVSEVSAHTGLSFQDAARILAERLRGQ